MDDAGPSQPQTPSQASLLFPAAIYLLIAIGFAGASCYLFYQGFGPLFTTKQDERK